MIYYHFLTVYAITFLRIDTFCGADFLRNTMLVPALHMKERNEHGHLKEVLIL